MPNWVRNQIIFKTKEDLNKALELCGIDTNLQKKEKWLGRICLMFPL